MSRGIHVIPTIGYYYKVVQKLDCKVASSKTRSSAVAERPRDASCHLNTLLSYSRAFELTMLSRACVSPY